jgi:DNA-directed RNA polymerase subunit RPC12/RpoP
VIGYRCPKCGKLLFKSDAPQGAVQVPCPRCGAIRLVKVGPQPVKATLRA